MKVETITKFFGRLSQEEIEVLKALTVLIIALTSLFWIFILIIL